MKNLFGVVALIFFALVFFGWLHQEHTYRYRITVPAGSSNIWYYTNAYSKRGNCVSFCEAERRDSSQVCGAFTIVQLR